MRATARISARERRTSEPHMMHEHEDERGQGTTQARASDFTRALKMPRGEAEAQPRQEESANAAGPVGKARPRRHVTFFGFVLLSFF